MGGLGYFAMRDVVTTLNELATQEALLEGSKEIQADLLRELAYVRDYIIFTDDASLNYLHTAEENLLVTLDEMLAIAADDSLREQFQTLKQKQEEYAVILQRVEDRVRKGDIDMSTVVLRARRSPIRTRCAPGGPDHRQGQPGRRPGAAPCGSTRGRCSTCCWPW